MKTSGWVNVKFKKTKKMTKFRKKPVVIDAFQMSYSNIGKLQKWVESHGDSFDKNFNFIDQGPDGANLSVNTLEGTSYETKPTDWIIRGIKGEYYPCNDEIFRSTYEPESGSWEDYEKIHELLTIQNSKSYKKSIKENQTGR